VDPDPVPAPAPAPDSVAPDPSRLSSPELQYPPSPCQDEVMEIDGPDNQITRSPSLPPITTIEMEEEAMSQVVESTRKVSLSEVPRMASSALRDISDYQSPEPAQLDVTTVDICDEIPPNSGGSEEV
jgi:hypothetical protein